MSMLFEVWGPDGHCKMTTNDVRCIYDERTLQSMVDYKHTFKLNGKKATKKDVVEFLKSSGVVGHELVPERIDASRDAATPITNTSKEVRCVTTGKTYKNQAEAAKDLGIDPAQVSDSIKTGRPRSGYIFEKV